MVEANIKQRYQNWKKGIRPGLEVAFSDNKRTFLTVLTSFTVFFLLVLSSFPEYSYQMLNSGFQYWSVAFTALFDNMWITVGPVSMIITGIYSFFTAIALLHAGVSLRQKNFEGKSLASLSPGLLITGCAGCGAGILGLLGFAGAIALLPFDGDLLKIAGIVLLIYFIGDSGNPEVCRI